MNNICTISQNWYPDSSLLQSSVCSSPCTLIRKYSFSVTFIFLFLFVQIVNTLYWSAEYQLYIPWLYFLERGVVWEETIILLPDNVHYVFLSATIPNASQFAGWIAHLHKQVWYSYIYSDFRDFSIPNYFLTWATEFSVHGDAREPKYYIALFSQTFLAMARKHY